MAPSAEKSTVSSPKPTTSRMAISYTPTVTTSMPPQRNERGTTHRKTVAFAVNYEPSMVDRYWHTGSTSSTSVGKQVKIVLGSTEATIESTGTTRRVRSSSSCSVTEDAKGPSTENRDDDEGDECKYHEEASAAAAGTAPTTKRRSAREQKQRSVNMTSSRVRYDMEMVPPVQRNNSFWDDVETWPPRKHRPKRRIESIPPTPTPLPLPLPTPLALAPKEEEKEKPSPSSPLSESVVWIPKKRKDWEDSISELTAVCTSAALRKFNSSHAPPKKPFVAPLSREYIRDRIDIDDPLRGFQIRHKTAGWLQGFLLWTNFTTWTHFFTWDSLHSLSGIATTPPGQLKDEDGSLAQELQALPRHGDPSNSGIVFENIAEIALLGGLQCGELLLRMALEEIRSNEQYQYVVLQATDGSRSFYERFGFQRVGAVCRYGKSTASKGVQAGSLSIPTLETPEQGYRHWTHANESQESLHLHGGPSYMMCLKLPSKSDNVPKGNLLEKMKPLFVEEKPTVEAMGAASTPSVKRRVKRTSVNAQPPPFPTVSSSADIPATIGSAPASMGTPRNYRPKRVYTDQNNTVLSDVEPNTVQPPKRRKVTEDQIEVTSTENQKNDVWLAVPPQERPKPTIPSTRKLRASTTAPTKVSPKSPKAKKSRSSISPDAPSLPSGPLTSKQYQGRPSPGVQKVDRATLCKQKVKSYPRDRLHYYNKVVCKNGDLSKGPYYFVLHYSEPEQEVTIVPMHAKGVLSGKRAGRPRYQCRIEPTSSNWLTVPIKDYSPVPAFMVMKTPIVAQEAWDILGA